MSILAAAAQRSIEAVIRAATNPDGHVDLVAVGTALKRRGYAQESEHFHALAKHLGPKVKI